MELKATDLRIGNLFRNPDTGNDLICTAMDISDIENGYKDRIGTPLTEELLLRFGFTKTEKGDEWGGYLSPETKYRRRMRIVNNEFSVPYFQVKVEFAHSIQNLFYAIYEEELKLKDL